jgi:hypothetical protein
VKYGQMSWSKQEDMAGEKQMYYEETLALQSHIQGTFLHSELQWS